MAKSLIFIGLTLVLLGRSSAGSAQCLALSQLLALASTGTAVGPPPTLPATEWTYTGPAADTGNLRWTSLDVGARPGKPAVSQLVVRPAQLTHDVVLKTTSGRCVRQLCRELEQQQLGAKPVTCTDGEGVRYQALTYSVTVYSRKKGTYPFAVVLRQTPAGATPDTTPAASGELGPD